MTIRSISSAAPRSPVHAASPVQDPGRPTVSKIQVGRPSSPGAPIDVLDARVEGSLLKVEAGNVGRPGQTSMFWDGTFIQTHPPKAALTLHLADASAHEIYGIRELSFDLSGLKAAYKANHGHGEGSLVLQVGDRAVPYSF